MHALSEGSLRSRQSVRDSVDEKLGTGYGLSYEEAYSKLNNPEKVEWLLGEFLIGLLNHSFHIWHQNFVDPEAKEGRDWLGIYRGLSEISCQLDQSIAELFSWTLKRAELGVALSSVVPYIWSHVWQPVPAWAYEMVERWPEDLDPSSLISDWCVERTVVGPSEEEPRFPQCSVALTESAKDDCLVKCAGLSREQIIEACSYGLWKCGASNQSLDDFFFELGGDAKEFVGTLCRWVSFDGDGGDRERRRFLATELDPLAKALGIESSAGSFVKLVDDSNFESMVELLADFHCHQLKPGEEPTPKQQLFSALRMDIDLILLRATEITDPEVWNVLLQAAMTGHILVIAGQSDQSKTLLGKLESMGTKIL